MVWVGRDPDVAVSGLALPPTGSQHLVTVQATAHSLTIRDAEWLERRFGIPTGHIQKFDAES